MITLLKLETQRVKKGNSGFDNNDQRSTLAINSVEYEKNRER